MPLTDGNALVSLPGLSLASAGALSVLIAVAQSNNEQRRTKARRTDRRRPQMVS